MVPGNDAEHGSEETSGTETEDETWTSSARRKGRRSGESTAEDTSSSHSSSCCFACCPSLRAYPPCLHHTLAGKRERGLCLCYWDRGGEFSRPSVRSLGPPGSDRESSLCWLQSSCTCSWPRTVWAALGKGWSQKELLISLFPRLWSDSSSLGAVPEDGSGSEVSETELKQKLGSGTGKSPAAAVGG